MYMTIRFLLIFSATVFFLLSCANIQKQKLNSRVYISIMAAMVILFMQL